MQNVLDIITWYKKNLRDLPWRSNNDPYAIWLSEVILQQTQVAQGLRYYYAFLAEYPDITALAAASEQDVLKLWQGLGYYSRARNLHKTAKLIHEKYHGKFPNDMKSLLELPGIGEYTASAILSFAFMQPFPVLDANVYRVLSRLYDIQLPVDDAASKPVFMEILYQMLESNNPSDFNNAMMELGALVCKPESPSCSACPCSGFCLSLKKGNMALLPVKKPKVLRRKRYFYYFLIRYKGNFYLEKRLQNDIWKHLYQLPLIEAEKELETADVLQLLNDQIVKTSSVTVGRSKHLKHILSHQEIHAFFTEIILQGKPVFKRKGLIEVTDIEYSKYPVPVLIEKFLLSL